MRLTSSRWAILHETSGEYVLARCSCGTEREVRRRAISSGRSRSCGCQRMSPVARFWEYVQKGAPDECWEWTGHIGPDRTYGKLRLDGKTIRAHRVSYEIHKGPIPPGVVIRHTCDNKPCVNPSHLIVGTGKDNARDAVERGLYRRGADNGRAKLTPSEVTEIKSCWDRGETQTSMARRFGVSRAAIQWVLSGRNWAHLEEAS